MVLSHVHHQVPPAQRVRRRAGQGVGQDGEHEHLGVPERVPVVPVPCQPLRRDRPVLGAGARLHDVEQAEPDCLLDLDVTVDFDVGALPERVQVLPLLLDQPFPAGQLGRGERAVDLVDQRGPRPLRRPAVAEVLHEAELLARLDLGGDRQPAEVRERLGSHRHQLRAFDVVRHRAGHPQLAHPGAVDENGARVLAVGRLVFLADQRRRQHGGGARVGGGDRHFLVGHDLREHDQAQGLVHRLDRVLDRGDGALGQRHQPHRFDLDGVPGRRGPHDRPGQGARAQVEGPGVGLHGPVPDVERLVVHQQPDHLAVGDVDDRLALFGEPVPGFGVRQRPDLVQRVQVRAWQPVRFPLIQVAAQADVPVGQGENRLALREQVQVNV